MKAKLGVIFGTANSALKGKTLRIFPSDTPFGETPSPIYEFRLPNGETIFCAERHGDGHVFSPSNVNYRAIIYKMKLLGVTHLLSFSAVGSLDEKIIPGKSIVLPLQLFDWTRGMRAHTFFDGDNDVVAHVSMADPICDRLAKLAWHFLHQWECSANHKKKFEAICYGTYVVIEGPTFSTRAESIFFKQTLGAAVVGMTALPEAKLAREAGLHYAVVATPADYDSWRQDCAGVDANEVKKGLEPYKQLPNILLPALAADLTRYRCETCAAALHGFAIHSDPNKIPWKKRKRYEPLLSASTHTNRSEPE